MRETNQLRKWSKENCGNGKSGRAPMCDLCGRRHRYDTICKGGIITKDLSATSGQPEPENSIAVSVGAATGIPADAEEGYSDWLNERNQLQNERDAEELEMFEQLQLQEETDDR